MSSKYNDFVIRQHELHWGKSRYPSGFAKAIAEGMANATICHWIETGFRETPEEVQELYFVALTGAMRLLFDESLDTAETVY